MTDDDNYRREIDDIRAALEAAENRFDADALTALLTDDVVVMAPDFDVQEGMAACSLFLHDVMDWLSSRFDRRVRYESAEVVVLGDAAYDRGTFVFDVRPRPAGDSVRVTGKYLWILRRTDSTWKVARLIASRDGDADHPAVAITRRATSEMNDPGT